MQLGTDETPERWVPVICVNYSRVEGANIAHIKPARVLSFFLAKLGPAVLVELSKKSVEVGPWIVAFRL